MWRSTACLGALAIGSSLLAGCGDNQDDTDTRDLLERVKAAQYRDWERAPGWPARRDSQGPHGGQVDIYVNDVVVEALSTPQASGRWPVGSIIVKDGFNGPDLRLVAAMEKRSDGWFWAEQHAGSDTPDYSGHPDVCIDCHAIGSDGVRAFSLP